MPGERYNYRQSAEALAGMSTGELSGLHDSLKKREKTGRGGHHLQSLQDKVAKQIKLRERQARRGR